jgi:hypothetical protein
MSKQAIALNEDSLGQKGNRKKQQDGSSVVQNPDWQPYSVQVVLEGVAPLLFHRYDAETVASQAKAAKGSREKKTDNIESFVYRNDDGYLCIPGGAFKAALADAARRFQDPSSPRKSARDLVRAGVLVNPYLASLGTKDWNVVDVRGVVIQRNRISRSRPMMTEGWRVTFSIEVGEAELIKPEFLRQLVDRAGRFNGLLDFRPDFGRFNVVSWNMTDRILSPV